LYRAPSLVCLQGGTFARAALVIFLASILSPTTFAWAKGPAATLGTSYHDESLGLDYTPPSNMVNRTERFRAQIQEQAKAAVTVDMLHALLAFSTGDDDTASNWGSVTIETYPRKSVPEPDDVKAEAQMNAWVAHSKDTSALAGGPGF
jgi:hypothetical protein